MSKTNRVVITGIGLITPLGNDTKTTWNSLTEGRSGIKILPQDFGLVDYPINIAGLVTGEKELLAAVFNIKQHGRTDRFTHLALIAAHEAMTDAGLSQTIPHERERFGTLIGIGIGGLQTMSNAAHTIQKDGPKRISPFTIPKVVSNSAPGWISMQWNLQGCVNSVVNACASSSDSVGMAFRMIRDGYADYMLAGGAEACVMPFSIAGFGNMRALSTWQGDPAGASRPFEKGRTGFVMSEGAAVLILERADLAQARGAKIYAEIVGYGATSDAYHMTAMHPEGAGAVRAMQMALDDAKIESAHIGYVNAHGTSTPMNDAIETIALKKVFGSSIDPVHPNHTVVSSTKSMTGHMLGAAGAAEAAFCALALTHNILPPTINYDQVDPACDLDYIPNVARQQSVNYAMSNSFGFGGGNAVLVLKRV